MRIIVAGSRNINDYMFVSSVLSKQNPFKDHMTTIISGGAIGVDSDAIRYADSHDIECRIVLPAWDKYGKSAGIIRNMEMGASADGLVAIWDGKSRGTEHMFNYMIENGKPTFVVRYDSSKTKAPL